MARKPEERGFYVSPKDPSSPIHCKVNAADGLHQITEAEARALSAAKRAGETVAPVVSSLDLADAQALAQAITILDQRVAEIAARPEAQSVAVESPDLKPLAEAVLALGRRIETVEKDVREVPVVVADLFQRAKAEEAAS